MPFDYKEFEIKCDGMTTEELDKQWEKYTREITCGSTSTATSILLSPLTGGVSLVGLGFSAPKIHNARKKREILDAHFKAHGTTHHTRVRDVVAPMTVVGGVGLLTAGLGVSGSDMIPTHSAADYLVTHAAASVTGEVIKREARELSKKKNDEAPEPVISSAHTWPAVFVLDNEKTGDVAAPVLHYSTFVSQIPSFQYQEQTVSSHTPDFGIQAASTWPMSRAHEVTATTEAPQSSMHTLPQIPHAQDTQNMDTLRIGVISSSVAHLSSMFRLEKKPKISEQTSPDVQPESINQQSQSTLLETSHETTLRNDSSQDFRSNLWPDGGLLSSNSQEYAVQPQPNPQNQTILMEGQDVSLATAQNPELVVDATNLTDTQHEDLLADLTHEEEALILRLHYLKMEREKRMLVSTPSATVLSQTSIQRRNHVNKSHGARPHMNIKQVVKTNEKLELNQLHQTPIVTSHLSSSPTEEQGDLSQFGAIQHSRSQSLPIGTTPSSNLQEAIQLANFSQEEELQVPQNLDVLPSRSPSLPTPSNPSLTVYPPHSQSKISRKPLSNPQQQETYPHNQSNSRYQQPHLTDQTQNSEHFPSSSTPPASISSAQSVPRSSSANIFIARNPNLARVIGSEINVQGRQRQQQQDHSISQPITQYQKSNMDDQKQDSECYSTSSTSSISSPFDYQPPQSFATILPSAPNPNLIQVVNSQLNSPSGQENRPEQQKYSSQYSVSPISTPPPPYLSSPADSSATYIEANDYFDQAAPYYQSVDFASSPGARKRKTTLGLGLQEWGQGGKSPTGDEKVKANVESNYGTPPAIPVAWNGS